MSDKTAINWTDATWPVVAGCEKVSPACMNCYAIRDSWRLAHNPNPKVGGVYSGTVEKRRSGTLAWTGTVRTLPQRLDWPLHWRKPRRIFVANMGDLFHQSVPFGFIDRVFAVMALAPQHTFQVLTKRPERMREWYEWQDQAEAGGVHQETQRLFPTGGAHFEAWPLPNVWLGVTVENQETADARIPRLIQVPAAVRFLSCEPLLGPISFRWMPAFPENAPTTAQNPSGITDHLDGLRRLDWVIAGGESGPHARPSNPEWFRSLRDQCAAAGVPFWFKQWGEWGEPESIEQTGVASHGWWEMAPEDGGVPCHCFGPRDLDPSVYRVGRKAAGKILDGKEHTAFPGRG